MWSPVQLDEHANCAVCVRVFQSSVDCPFVPTVTAIATAPDLKWMVLSTDISSVSPCSGDQQKRTRTPQKKAHTPQNKAHTHQPKAEPETGSGFSVGRRKGQKEQVHRAYSGVENITHAQPHPIILIRLPPLPNEPFHIACPPPPVCILIPENVQ